MNVEFEITDETKAVKTMEAKMDSTHSPQVGTGTMETVKTEDRNQKTVEKIYRYEDEKGELLYEVVRYEPKGFSQRKSDGNGGYINNTQSVRRVLYKLPQLIATPLDVPVIIVEGEKDADRLISEGLPATTNSGGAGKWLRNITSILEDDLSQFCRIMMKLDTDTRRWWLNHFLMLLRMSRSSRYRREGQ